MLRVMLQALHSSCISEEHDMIHTVYSYYTHISFDVQKMLQTYTLHPIMQVTASITINTYLVQEGHWLHVARRNGNNCYSDDYTL